jgi:DNA-binding beta-propeller fold protein YncE
MHHFLRVRRASALADIGRGGGGAIGRSIGHPCNLLNRRLPRDGSRPVVVGAARRDTGRMSRAAAVLGIILALATPIAALAGARSDRLGAFLRQVEDLRDPRGVAVGPDGSILVAESDDNAVRRLDRDGRTVDRWLPIVAAESAVVAPYGIATDGAAVFITDRGHDRVVVVAADGTPLRAFGGHGTRRGRLDRPAGIAVGGGRVVVADSGNDRLQVFDVDGADMGAIGRRGTAPGEFLRPLGVALDEDGTIYVADTGNHRIQKLDRDGTVQRVWGERGSFPGLMTAPSAVAVHGGRVFVADGLGHRVQVFDRDGTFLMQWGMHAVVPREGDGRIHYPSGLAIAADGSLAVVSEAFENRIQLFGPLAPGEVPPGGMLPPGLDEQAHFGPLLAAGGPLLAVWEPPSQSIALFDVTAGAVPILVTSFGEPGRRFGQLADPAALSMTADGRWLDVADVGARRLQRFRIDLDPAAPVRFDPFMARFAKAWGFAALARDEARGGETTAMARAADGRVLTVDRRTNQIVEHDGQMRPVRRFGGRGETGGGLLEPIALAVDDARRRVYVADAWGRCVVVYGMDGTFAARWENDAFFRPAGIAVDGNGRVHVSDSAADGVMSFEPDGTLVRAWGGTGTGHGEFWKPGQIVLDRQGRLVVVDYGNHRLQAFDTDGTWLVTFGAGRAWTREDAAARGTATP